MNRESLLKIYAGNKLIGSHYPILVVTGDNTRDKIFFGEHYLFADIAKLPFVARRDMVTPEDTSPELFNFDNYPEIFSAESLLKNQLISAYAHFANAFSTLNMKAYKEIFWEGRTFEFCECSDHPLKQFKIFGKYIKEITAMFEYSRSKKIQELKEKLSALPKVKIESSYDGEK